MYLQGVLSWDEVIAGCNWDSKRYRQLVSDIMKIIDESESFDTRCVVMRWSNNEM